MYILLGIVLLIAIILSLRIKLHIIYRDELQVFLKIAFFKIPIIPDTKNSFSKLRKKKSDSGANPIKRIQNESPETNSIIDKLNAIRDILSILSETFHKHLHVKLSQVHIRVAASDAAKTAILYGAICTAVACIIDQIENIANLKSLKQSSVAVEPDFLSEKIDVKLNIVLYMSVWDAIAVLLKSFIRYYSLKDNTQINDRKEK